MTNQNTNPAPLAIFAGQVNLKQAKQVCANLEVSLGQAVTGRFSDGEINIKLMENVRGKDVFIIQSTMPPTDNLMELVLLTDALKRSSCGSVTAIVPYFGCSRQDRRIRSERVPISAKVVANILTHSGVDRVVTMDLHAEQIQGFFDIPVDNIYSTGLFANYVLNELSYDIKKCVVISPDIGGVVRARALAKRIGNLDLAIVDKRRHRENEAEAVQIIGHVSGKICIVTDDIVDTAGTLCESANILKNNNAQAVIALITHPILSGQAYEKIKLSSIDLLVVTDSIPVEQKFLDLPNFKVIPIASVLSDSIKAIRQRGSIKKIFE